MDEENPYAGSGKTGELDASRKPLFWSRMVRHSIHFTILGVLLAGLRIYVALKQARDQVSEDDVSEQVDAMNMTISTIASSLGFAALFLALGVASVIVSLVMRHLEKKRRNVVSSTQAQS